MPEQARLDDAALIAAQAQVRAVADALAASDLPAVVACAERPHVGVKVEGQKIVVTWWWHLLGRMYNSSRTLEADFLPHTLVRSTVQLALDELLQHVTVGKRAFEAAFDASVIAVRDGRPM